LVQDADLQLHHDLKVVTSRQPTEDEMRDLLFTWRVAKFVKSNAIVYCRDGMTIGVGAGMSGIAYFDGIGSFLVDRLLDPADGTLHVDSAKREDGMKMKSIVVAPLWPMKVGPTLRWVLTAPMSWSSIRSCRAVPFSFSLPLPKGPMHSSW
jgi:hypothetical protein